MWNVVELDVSLQESERDMKNRKNNKKNRSEKRDVRTDSECPSQEREEKPRSLETRTVGRTERTVGKRTVGSYNSN